jgi:hypothetical protein
MKRRIKILLGSLVLSVAALPGAATYAHDHVPHTCHKMKTRAMHGCHHTDDEAELRQAEKNEKSKKFGSSPCTCPWWCFINGSPDPLMDW